MKANHFSDTPSTNSKVVENQHFVPKFYLRRFTNQSGLLERLEIGSGEILSVPRPPSSECVIPFFYGQFTGQLDEASQKIEKYWQDIESLIAPKIDGVEKNITEHKRINEEENNT